MSPALLRILASRKTLLISGVIAVLAIAFMVGWSIRRIYSAGFDAGKAQAVTMIAAARTQAAEDLASAQRKVLDLERSMRALEQQYAERIAAARAEREIQIRTVERVIRENPDFAATVRPVELDRVRDEQHAAIAAAAARGAATASKLPGASLPAVPAASDRDRRHARPDGGG